jgi:hypothetical protein
VWEHLCTAVRSALSSAWCMQTTAAVDQHMRLCWTAGAAQKGQMMMVVERQAFPSTPFSTYRVQICGWDIIVDTGTRRKDQRECGGPVERTECTARIGYALSGMLCGLLQKKAVLFKHLPVWFLVPIYQIYLVDSNNAETQTAR